MQHSAFDAESREHQRGQRLRVMSRWAQLVALGLGQLTGRQSLRDIVANLQVQSNKLYHLGVRTVSCSSLARVNAEQPYTLYEAVFSRLLSRCQQQAPGQGFRFKHKLYAVDASTIDLCLAVVPWATFRRRKAAVELHVGLDQAGQLPSFVSLTEGKRGDVTGRPDVAISGRQCGRGRPCVSRFQVAASIADRFGDVRHPPQARRALPGHRRARR